MYSIILIIPYFGKFNDYISFWLKSVENNPTVNFLIITDQDITVPSNVMIVKMTFNDCVKRFQSLLDCDVSSLHPYKLCDFKPAYGYLFHDYIKDYDFWGYCDNDLIFGNIRHFITDAVLKRNDRILTRGHFTLYRNTPFVNEVFKKALPSYKKVFTSELVFHFDEHPGTGKYWFEKLRERLYDEIIFDDLKWSKYQFVDVHKYILDKNRKFFIYSYENGKLFRCFWENDCIGREEIMYVHFQKRNMKVKTPVSDFFTIVPNMFTEYKKQLDYDYLRANTFYWPFYEPLHFISVKWKSFRRKIWLWKRKHVK